MQQCQAYASPDHAQKTVDAATTRVSTLTRICEQRADQRGPRRLAQFAGPRWSADRANLPPSLHIIVAKGIIKNLLDTQVSSVRGPPWTTATFSCACFS